MSAPEAAPAYTALDTSVFTLEPSSLFFAPVAPEYLDRIHSLEAASYPDDEAATFEKLEYRIANAANAFMVALQSSPDASEPRVVGFVCGTCTTAGKLTHAAMSTHEPEGDLLCVHSVVVEAQLRRTGVATRMLKAYRGYVAATSPNLRAIHLICKSDLIPLYEKAGYRLLGPSDVVHGQDPWFEMAQDVGCAADASAGAGAGDRA